MRQRILLAGIAPVLFVLFAAAHHARAQDGPYPVGLRVDDPKVVLPVDVNGGLGFRGVGPGTTLCSAASAVGPRRVFRFTVR